MRLKSFLFALLASVLFVLLVAACGNDDDGATCSVDDSSYELGGPYPKDGEFAKGVLEGKQNEFAGYMKLELSVSQAVKLPGPDDAPIFQDAIRANFDKSSGQQRYNYAITVKCEIFMAAWQATGNSTEGDAFGEEFDVACAGGRDTELSIGKAGVLINFAPEQPFGDKLKNDPKSPCWLDAEREKGILDAISKHFMLAQAEGGNIGAYEEKKWSEKKVAYAGEILVNTGACTYVLTNGSGTYKPLSKGVVAANDYFARVVTGGKRQLDRATVCR